MISPRAVRSLIICYAVQLHILTVEPVQNSSGAQNFGEFAKNVYTILSTYMLCERGVVMGRRKGLNELDRAILEVYQKNCLLSPSKIAEEIHCHRNTVSRTLNRLREEGFISGVQAVLNPWKLDRKAGANILVTLRKTSAQKKSKAWEVARGFHDFYGVQSVYVTSGPYDVIVRTRTQDNFILLMNTIEQIRSQEEVQTTLTCLDMAPPIKESLDIEVNPPSEKNERADPPSEDCDLTLIDGHDMLPFGPWFYGPSNKQNAHENKRR